MSKKIKTDIQTNKDKLSVVQGLLRNSGALFDTLDLDVYKNRLDNFSLNELYGEAERIGLKRGAERSHCTRAILETFNEYRSKFSLVYGGVENTPSLDEVKRNKVRELMKDGKP